MDELKMIAEDKHSSLFCPTDFAEENFSKPYFFVINA